MKALIPGLEPKEKIDLLLSETQISNQDMVSALHDVYVKGLAPSSASALNNIDQGNLCANQKILERIACMVYVVKEIDWKREGYKTCGGWHK